MFDVFHILRQKVSSTLEVIYKNIYCRATKNINSEIEHTIVFKISA